MNNAGHAPEDASLSLLELSGRLERLPMTGYLWTLVLIAGGAWFVESLSIGMIGVVLPILKPLWHLSPGQMGVLATASTLGVVIGLIPAGRLADRFGRVKVLTWGIVGYSLLTLLSAWAPDYAALTISRVLAGLAMGSVFPLPYAIVGEIVQKHQRSYLSGILDAILSVGYFAAPLMGLLLLPHLSGALSWRVLMGLAGLPIVYAWLVHRWLPESPRWLWQQGRPADALSVLTHMESETAKRLDSPLSEPTPPVDASATLLIVGPPQPWPRLFWRTAVSAAGATGTFFMFYVVMTYMPTIFAAIGTSLPTALGFAAVVTLAAVPGKILNGHLSERWGRKPTFVVYMISAAICALLFTAAQQPTWMLVDAVGMSFFGTGAFPGLKMYYAEQYPTAQRVTGSSVVEAVARTLGGIVGAALMPGVWHTEGMGFAFALIAAIAILSSLVVAIGGKETAGLTLEAIQVRYNTWGKRSRGSDANKLAV